MGCLALALLGGQKRKELLCKPCILGISRRGDKIRIGCLTPAFSRGPIRGRNCHVTLAFSASLEEESNSELVASTLPSRGPKRGRNCYVTPAFSRVSRRADKIRSGCLTLAFSGAQKEVELPPKPGVLISL